MSRLIEDKIKEAYFRAIEQKRQISMCTHVLSNDGHVLRIWPDGQQETIGLGLRPRQAPHSAHSR